jgi:uncharacterized membrane protein YbhN (UPF0104 family)
VSAKGREEHSREQDELLGFDRRKALVAVALAALLALGAIALIGQAVDFGKLLDALTGADPRWLPVCLCGELIAYGGYILGYRDIARARGGPRFDYWATTRVVLVGFGALVVGSGAGGLAVDFWALQRAGEDAHQAGRRVLALNTLEWAVLGLFAALASVALLAGADEGAPVPLTLGWICGVTAAIIAAVWITQPHRCGRFAELPAGEEPTERGVNLLAWGVWLWVKLKKGFADAVGGVAFVRYLLVHPRQFPGAAFGFGFYWLGDLLTMYAALRAFGEHLGPAALIVGYATGYIVTSAPLPAGAAGISEATTAFSLHLVGVPLAHALLAVLVYRAFTFWLPIIPALAALPLVRGLAQELPHKERGRDDDVDEREEELVERAGA